MWLPDLDIYNVKEIDEFKVLKKLAGLWVSNGTQLYYSQSILVTIFCPMHYGWYPLDSQASFLIEPDIVAGRMMLLTTLFLVLINLMNNLTSNAPNSEGINAVSAWLLSCIIFVFAALVAYSGILLKNKIRKQKIRNKICKSPRDDSNNTKSFNCAENVDVLFLISFPLMFIIFNVVYWSLVMLNYGS